MRHLTIADGWNLTRHADGNITVTDVVSGMYVFFGPTDGVIGRFLRDLFDENYEDTDEG